MSQKSVDVANVLATATIKPFHIAVVGLSAFIVMLDGYDTLSIAFVAPSMARALSHDVTAFGPIFGIGLLGLVLGSLAISPLADRFGRKSLLLVTTLIFGLFSLAPALDPSFERLFLYRFITGLGLGGAMPCAIALTSEYAPAHRKAMLVNIMFAGFPFGAVVGGFVASQLIARYGWPSAFVLGGVLPLLAVPVIALLMPDSVMYLAARQKNPGAIARVLRRIDPNTAYDKHDRFVLAETGIKGGSIRSLFTDNRAFGTGLLWLGFFCNLLILFFLNNWLPAVMDQTGLPPQRAVLAPVLLNLGGVIGGVTLGMVIDRFGAARAIAASFLGAAVFVALIGSLVHMAAAAMACIFFAGFFVIGAQLSMNAMVASFYPTDIRSTGIGWALGIGRIGSIVGPVLGGIVLGLKWNVATIFLAAAVPAVAGAIAIYVVGRRYPATNTRTAAAQSTRFAH